MNPIKKPVCCLVVSNPPSCSLLDKISPCGFSHLDCGLLSSTNLPSIQLPCWCIWEQACEHSHRSPRNSPGGLWAPPHRRPGGTCPLQTTGKVTSISYGGPGLRHPHLRSLQLPPSQGHPQREENPPTVDGPSWRGPCTAHSLLILLLRAHTRGLEILERVE